MTTIIQQANHQSRPNEYVVLGKEEGWRDNVAYFTRRGNADGQFSGHYNMTLREALADFEKRLKS